MHKFMDFLQNKLALFGEKVSKQHHLGALREGFMLAMPLVLIGSLFQAIVSFPMESFIRWLRQVGLDAIFNSLISSSFGLIALLTCFGVAYRLATSYNANGLSAGALTIASTLLATPPTTDKAGVAGIPYPRVGGRGLFTAIIVGLITAEIFRWFVQEDITIKMPDSVPEVVGKSFIALTPGVVILTFFETVAWGISLAPIGNLNSLLGIVIGAPLGLIGGTLIGTFITILLNSLFWFCGVDDGQVVSTALQPVWLQAATANLVTWQAGRALPNIITLPFIDLFVYIDGGGATIGLALYLVLLSKSKEYEVLGEAAGIPASFNTNTTILFSFPTALNPIVLIPLLLAPVTNAVITYFAITLYLVPLTTGAVTPWTMSPIIGGLFACGGSWAAAISQLILIIVSFLIYYPFFKATDTVRLKAEMEKESK